MPATRKLLLILIDGLGASYFAKHRRRLPHLDEIAGRGLFVERMFPDMPATSMPGRASILTGATPERHGIYGNRILGSDAFRCVTAEDVNVPTIATQAHEAGLDVACVGFGLVRAQDATTFHAPWWLHGFLNRASHVKSPADPRWRKVPESKDPGDRLSRSHVGDVPVLQALPAEDDQLQSLLAGLGSDQVLMRCAADLACSDSPPDLILTEIATPDMVQHEQGYETDAAHWALAHADMLVGMLLRRLETAGRAQDYAIAITSDHGHAPIETAIYPEAIIPENVWETEGATLHVAVDNHRDRATVARKLEAFDVVEHESVHVPEGQRDKIATFSAPERHAFERKPAASPADQQTGRAITVSTHGLRPGSPLDDRICMILVPEAEQRSIEAATAPELTPTLASLLGLPVAPYQAAPLI